MGTKKFLSLTFWICVGWVWAAQAAQAPYFADFESGIGAEWSSAKLEGAANSPFTRFTGRFSHDTQTLTLDSLMVGQSYTVGFDFYAIDSLDGSYGGSGDFFNVGVDGFQVFHETFSNYNGNPPSNPQSYANAPDEGRAHFGFHASFVDAIYRNIEVSFVASNATVQISFSGQNLQDIGDESWGLDNVAVNLTSAIASAIIRSTTLPAAGATAETAIERFSIISSRDLATATANTAANYDLREAGANGAFGDGDDTIYTLTPAHTAGKTVRFTFNNAPLQPGTYQFKNLAGLQDINNGGVTPFTREFTVANPVLGKIENTSNETIPTATPLPVTETPVGSGFFTALGVGTFSVIGDVDYWRFDAEAGDRVTLHIAADELGVYPQLYLQNAAGQNLRTAGGNYEGHAEITNFEFENPGTFYFRAHSDNNPSSYRVRLDLGRGVQLENEPNDNPAQANLLELTSGAGSYQGRIAGWATAPGDYIRLTTLNPGNAISVQLLLPNGSSLTAANATLSIEIAGNADELTVSTTGSLNYTVASDGIHYVHIRSTAPDALRAQYLLQINVTDGVAPRITGDNLPAEGTTSTNIIDRLALQFSEDLSPATVIDPANYDLRAAGTGGNFNSPDDVIYTVTPNAYAGGLSASYLITDGPLQAGSYRFTAKTTLKDTVGNALATPYVRNFSVTDVSGLRLENRDNNAVVKATSLSANPSAAADGTFAFLGTLPAGSNPYFVAIGQFNGDTKLDLVVANYNSDNVSILLGVGDGTFQRFTNYAAGDGPIAAAVADLRGNGKQDVVTVDNSGASVSVLLGNNDGTFAPAVSYSVGNSPRSVAVVDFNGDTQLDLVAANVGNDNVSVLLGNGDGTFGPRTNYPAGNGPHGVAVADFNGDGKVDVATANVSSDDVSVLLGNGDGTFGTRTNFPAANGPRSIAVGDLNGDGRADVTVVATANFVSVLLGNGDGTFAPPTNYPTGGSDPYHIVLADLNGDSKLDVAVGNHGGNVSVFLGHGDGTLSGQVHADSNGSAIALAVGDYNGDGRVDLATANYNAANASVLLGNNVDPLTEDPPGSGIRTGGGRGNLQNITDVDYWSFAGTAGDSLVVAVEVPGNPNNTGLFFRVERPDGVTLTDFYGTVDGWGQSAPVTLPFAGTYFVRVSYYHQHFGEYRLRVTTATPALQLESEPNNTVGQADVPAFTLSNGHQVASMLGYLNAGDGGGDFYSLGNLSPGTAITLGINQPATSGFADVLGIYNAAGTAVANSAVGANSLAYTIPADGDGAYYARVMADVSGAALKFDGVDGYAVRFNGVDNYVQTADAPSLRPVDFTLEGWVNFSAVGGTRVLFGKTLGTGFFDSYVVWHQDGRLRAVAQNGSGAGAMLDFVWAPTLGTWYHVAYAFDSVAKLQALYINGVPQTSGATTSIPAFDSHPFMIGAEYDQENLNYFFSGQIDEVRLWNIARSQAQIQADMQKRLVGTESGLVLNWRLDEGIGNTTSDLTANANHGTLINHPVWVPSNLTKTQMPGLFAQYILNLDLADTSPPSITSNSLPAEGATTTGIIDRFLLDFSEDMNPSTVTNILSYELRSAGGNGNFGDGDDQLYTVQSTGYTSGLQSDYRVPDGPLQPGKYRFTVKTVLQDRAGNGLAAPYVRDFEVAAVNGFVFENRDNDSYVTATSLSVSPSPNPDGSFLYANSTGVGNNPYFVVKGLLNGDNHLDLVSANISSDNISVLIGNGDGTFVRTTNYPTGNGPISLALGDVNGDSKLDVVTANYNNASVSVLLGNADGTFNPPANYAVGNSPRAVVLADFNGDTKPDLVTANLSSDNVSLLLGNGDGTFGPRTNWPAANGPHGVAVGDFNKDGKLDVAAANVSSDNLSVLLGNGDGTFGTTTNWPAGNGPRSIATSDLNGDGNLDLVTVNANVNTVSVLLGNGDGTFAPAVNYPTGGSDPYHIIITDLNADNKSDVAVGNHGGNVSLFSGNGDGTLSGPVIAATSGSAIAIAVGDYNNDGLLDLATANYNAHRVDVSLANNTEGLTEDPAGSGIRTGTGRGNISSTSDWDYWSFSALAGDRLVVACDVPGNPASSGLYYRIDRPDGSQLTDFSADQAGWGQSTPVVIPGPGTYFLRVRYYHQYFGEYRFRVTLARPPIQIETEVNNNVNQANVPALALNNGHQVATILGYSSVADEAGDFFTLGNLSSSALVRLNLAKPSSSDLAAILGIYNSAGTLMANNAVGSDTLSFTIPSGADDAYFVRVLGARPTYTGTSGTALQFDGGGNVVDTGAWTPGTNWTIEAWVNPSSLPGGRRTIAGGYSECRDFGIAMVNGQFVAAMKPPGGCTANIVANLPVTTETWYHVAGSCDGTTARIFINGMLQNSGPVEPGYVATAAGVRIGGEVCCGGNNFPGTIDEVRIWNRALTEAEINANKMVVLAGNESGLLGYWRFNEGTGNTTADLVSPGHIGTLNGPAWVQLGQPAAQSFNLMAQYILNIDLGDALPATITTDSLPDEGTTTPAIIDRFTLGFSEDMTAATVTNAASYDLRAAGTDDAFDTTDDVIYSVNSTGYISGLSSAYFIGDGPLQPGRYRFTAKTTLLDRAGNPLAAPHVRTFIVTGVSGFILESRDNDDYGTALSLSLAPNNTPDGSFNLLGATTPVGNNPYFVAQGLINNDANLDLVVANINSDNVSVLLGGGDGMFQPYTNRPAGNGPIALALADLNADGKLDVITANRNGANASVLLGNGDGNFSPPTTYPAGNNPRAVAIADFNLDNKPDFVVANESTANVSVLLGNGDGTFQARVNYAAGNGPFGVAADDVNGDGRPDLAVANVNSDNVSLLLGNGDGTFGIATNWPAGNGPRSVALGDLNGDGRRDIVVVNASVNSVSVLLGNGDGTFAPAVNFATGGSDPYHLILVDLNGDGRLDVVVGNHGGSVSVFVGNGDGTLSGTLNYGTGGSAISVAAGDYNNDGRIDLAAANYHGNNVRIMLGNDTETLAEDPAGSGIRTSSGRGNISSTSDWDYWSFSAQTGERLVVASDMPGNPPSSGLYFRVDRPNGAQLVDFAATPNGWGQSDPVIIPQSGTYFLRVRYNYQHFGEYRFRVTLARPPTQLESEDNNNHNLGNVLSFAAGGGHQTAKVLGYISVGDNSGDFFKLGNLSSGTTIALGMTRPASSGLSATMAIYNAAGTAVATSIAGDASLNYTIPSAADGAYSVRVTAEQISSGLFAQYLLSLDLAGVLPPAITSLNLPAQDSTASIVLDRFNIGFSEDMKVSTVTSAASYDLRSAGGDGNFDTGDDEVYTVLNQNYVSGLSASYRITDGPLQAGRYRFTITTALQDREGNPLTSPFVRNFTVVSAPDFVIEDRDNETRETATPLVLVEDPSALKSGGGQGNLSDAGDVDFWSFTGTAGDELTLGVDIPGNPPSSQLHYRIQKPDGAELNAFYANSTDGWGQSPRLLLPDTGTYTLRVQRNYDYQGEYRIRVMMTTAPMQMEAEDNPNLATASPINLAIDGNTRFGSIAGYVRINTDLDYFNLGPITNGTTVYLSTRLPVTSHLAPVVSLYDAANNYQLEAGSGRSFDGVAEVNITQTGNYYAVVRGGEATSGLSQQYSLDVQAVPTGSVNFPNLQVTDVTIPTGNNIQSGQPITFSFAVKNVGTLPTPGANWLDRVVMSVNKIPGDADDIPLGVFVHNGALNPDESYSGTRTVALPDRVSGSFYLIVQTDFGNAVNEFVLEGDNITVSSSTFDVTQASQELQVLAQPQSQTVALGSAVTLTVTATGVPPLSYQWRLNGVNLAGATSSVLVINNFQIINAGNYVVTIASGANTIDSDIAHVTVSLPALALANNFSAQVEVNNLAFSGSGSNVDANREAGEQNHAGKLGAKSVWITWVAPANGIATFSTAGTSFDTLLAIYRGDTLAGLTEVASDDDRGGFLTSVATFNAVTGIRYRIAMDGFAGAFGDIVLSWNLEVTPEVLPEITSPPASQTVALGATVVFSVQASGANLTYQWFFNGTVIPGAAGSSLTRNNVQVADVGSYIARVTSGSRFIYSVAATLQINTSTAGTEPVQTTDKFADVVNEARSPAAPQSVLSVAKIRKAALARGFTGTQIFTTFGAAKEQGEPNHCGIVGGASQWFAYEAAANGPLTIDTDGSTFDTVLAVYTGTGDDFASLQLAACDNDSGADGKDSRVSFAAVQGTIYYIAVDGVNAATGEVILHYNLSVPLQLTGPVLAAPLRFSFKLSGRPGGRFTIQSSTNLINWVNLLTTNALSGTFDFAEPDIRSFGLRLYRAILEQ